MVFNFFKKLVPERKEPEPDPPFVAPRRSVPVAPAAPAAQGQSGVYAEYDPKAKPAAPAPESIQGLDQQAIIAEWLNQLPEHVRPYRLTDHYPRLAVKMAELWRKPIPLQNYLRGLVLDDRGGRQGFPEDIAGELLRLMSYVEEKLGVVPTPGFGRAGRDWGDSSD
jgi:hypothetical protein